MPCAALERHPDSPCAALRGITASVERTAAGRLEVLFALEGEIDRLRVPPPRPPRAAERLWESTCCEVFVAPEAMASYREFNLSPSGEWAAYAFTSYRSRTPLADPLPDPRICVSRDAAVLRLSATIPVQAGRLRIGLAAVIEDREGSLSYWALRHAQGKPDFHHSHAFALALDEARH